MLDRLTSEDFEACLHQRFEIYYNATDAVESTLVDVATWGEPYSLGESTSRQPFSLLFLAEQEGHLPQQIYRVVNETLGELHIFLVPLGPESGKMRYEAVFT